MRNPYKHKVLVLNVIALVGGTVLFEILRVMLAWNNSITVFGIEEKRLVVTGLLTGSCLSGPWLTGNGGLRSRAVSGRCATETFTKTTRSNFQRGEFLRMF